MVENVWMNPVLLIVIPLGLAFLTPIFALITKKIVKYIPVLGMLFNLVLSILLLPKVMNTPIVISLAGWVPPLSINLFVGPVSILFLILISLVGFFVAIYGINYIKEGAIEKYNILYLLIFTGATGVVLTGDIFNLFVFFEILCISSYALVAYKGDKAGTEASIKYLIQGSIGTGFILIGIGLLYGLFGTLNIADIASNINSVNSSTLYVALAFFISGLGIEAAIFPLNAWLPDAHSSAPSSISAVLSGMAIHVGVYAVFRVIYTIFGVNAILNVLVFMGILTMLIGEMSAFRQNDIKRVLAYSSIGQMGLIIFALSIGTVNGTSAGLFQIITHTLAKTLLFLCAGYMIYYAGSKEISSLEGMGKKMPVASLLFTIGAFTLVGLPPFIGFPSKLLIILSALSKGGILFLIMVIFMLCATILEGTYFFKIIQVLYFKGPKNIKREKEPITLLFPGVILILFIIFIGIYPQIITGFLNKASSALLDKSFYIKSVLGGG